MQKKAFTMNDIKTNGQDEKTLIAFCRIRDKKIKKAFLKVKKQTNSTTQGLVESMVIKCLKDLEVL